MLAEGRCWCILVGQHKAICCASHSGRFWVFIFSLCWTSNIDKMYFFCLVSFAPFQYYWEKNPTCTHKVKLTNQMFCVHFLGSLSLGIHPLGGKIWSPHRWDSSVPCNCRACTRCWRGRQDERRRNPLYESLLGVNYPGEERMFTNTKPCVSDGTGWYSVAALCLGCTWPSWS